ncbi:hypothetical protein V3C99_003196 [Haemonchus contortus]
MSPPTSRQRAAHLTKVVLRIGWFQEKIEVQWCDVHEKSNVDGRRRIAASEEGPATRKSKVLARASKNGAVAGRRRTAASEERPATRKSKVLARASKNGAVAGRRRTAASEERPATRKSKVLARASKIGVFVGRRRITMVGELRTESARSVGLFHLKNDTICFTPESTFRVIKYY